MPKYLVLIVLDGVRFSDTWGTPANIPNIVKLSSTGSVILNMFTGESTETIPGHSALLTGKNEIIKDDGTQSPYFPSYFQEYLYNKGISSTPSGGYTNRAKMICSKDTLNCLNNCTMNGPYQNYRPYCNAGLHGNGTGGYRRDIDTHNLFKTQCLGNDPPELSMVSYSSADTYADTGNWNAYILAIKTLDTYVQDIINTINSHPLMNGNTNIIITTDHGRGDGTLWVTSGGSSTSERHTIFVAVGPDIKPSQILTINNSINIANTAMYLLGMTKNYTEGILIEEMLNFTESSSSSSNPIQFENESSVSAEFGYKRCLFKTLRNQYKKIIPDYVENIEPLTSLSLAGWVRGSNYVFDQFIVGTPPGPGYRLWLKTDGLFSYPACTLGVTTLVSKTKILNNRWCHLAMTWDGTTLKLYVNGKVVDQDNCDNVAYRVTPFDGAFHILGDGEVQNDMPIMCFDVALWQLCLTKFDILTLQTDYSNNVEFESGMLIADRCTNLDENSVYIYKNNKGMIDNNGLKLIGYYPFYKEEIGFLTAVDVSSNSSSSTEMRSSNSSSSESTTVKSSHSSFSSNTSSSTSTSSATSQSTSSSSSNDITVIIDSNTFPSGYTYLNVREELRFQSEYCNSDSHFSGNILKWNGTEPIKAVFIIKPGVTLNVYETFEYYDVNHTITLPNGLSANTGVLINYMPAGSKITIVNYGTILGKPVDVISGLSGSEPRGAIHINNDAQLEVRIYNYGVITGGGGLSMAYGGAALANTSSAGNKTITYLWNHGLILGGSGGGGFGGYFPYGPFAGATTPNYGGGGSPCSGPGYPQPAWDMSDPIQYANSVASYLITGDVYNVSGGEGMDFINPEHYVMSGFATTVIWGIGGKGGGKGGVAVVGLTGDDNSSSSSSGVINSSKSSLSTIENSSGSSSSHSDSSLSESVGFTSLVEAGVKGDPVTFQPPLPDDVQKTWQSDIDSHGPTDGGIAGVLFVNMKYFHVKVLGLTIGDFEYPTNVRSGIVREYTFINPTTGHD